MIDPLAWTFPLGRWSGTQVRVHALLVVFAVGMLLQALMGGPSKGHPALESAAWLALLGLALALHELGHASMAARLGIDLEEVRVGPLGGLWGPATPAAMRSPEGLYVAAAGPITSAVLALVSALGLSFAHAQMVFNPFGNPDGGGAPYLADGHLATPLTSAVWWIGWFGYLNWVIFLANLLPALPMDGGRFIRIVQSGPWTGPVRDNLIGPWTAHSCALILLIVGLFKLNRQPASLILIGLAVLIEWLVHLEARLLEDGGYFDAGVFGYDFSQGYTSLEAGSAKVRPYRESALKRWRRRRSEARRQRREAREAAEEQRMDEILAKLHREGRSALTDDEHRFLVRVSAKYRNRSKARG